MISKSRKGEVKRGKTLLQGTARKEEDYVARKNRSLWRDNLVISLGVKVWGKKKEMRGEKSISRRSKSASFYQGGRGGPQRRKKDPSPTPRLLRLGHEPREGGKDPLSSGEGTVLGKKKCLKSSRGEMVSRQRGGTRKEICAKTPET